MSSPSSVVSTATSGGELRRLSQKTFVYCNPSPSSAMAERARSPSGVLNAVGTTRVRSEHKDVEALERHRRRVAVQQTVKASANRLAVLKLSSAPSNGALLQEGGAQQAPWERRAAVAEEEASILRQQNLELRQTLQHHQRQLQDARDELTESSRRFEDERSSLCRDKQTLRSDLLTLTKELDTLRMLRQSERGELHVLQRKTHALEAVITSYRSQSLVDASCQTDEALPPLPWDLSHRSHTTLSTVYRPHESDDIVVSVASPVRRAHAENSDNVPATFLKAPQQPSAQGGPQSFVNHISATFASQPELAELLGSLFVAKTFVPLSSPPQSQKPHSSQQLAVTQLEGKKYPCANILVSANPFDAGDEEELAPAGRPAAVTATVKTIPSRHSLNVSPAAAGTRCVPRQSVVIIPSAPAPSELTSPPPRKPVSLDASPPLVDINRSGTDSTDGLHLGSLFARHLRATQNIDATHLAPARVCTTDVATSFDSDSREFPPLQLRLAPPEQQPVPTGAASKTYSPASTTSISPASSPDEDHRTATHSTITAGPPPPRSSFDDDEFYDLSPKVSICPPAEVMEVRGHQASLTPLHYTSAFSSHSPAASILRSSSSKSQPCTPLPPTPSSISPFRTRESVERIDRLRRELQSLIDVRLRLQSAAFASP